MNFTLIDAADLMVAVTVGGLILVLPGMALARMFGLSQGSNPLDPLTGSVAGLALLPVLDSLAARLVSLDAALAINLALALAAIFWMIRGRIVPRASWIGLVLAGFWLLLVALETVDFDIAGKLYQPLTVFDMVKHAATTQAIYDSGAPPRDAFFLRPERASYYYFFYTLPALIMRLCGGLVDAKAAFAGMMFWTGIAAFGLVVTSIRCAGLGRAFEDDRQKLLIVAVLAAGGLDILAALVFAFTRSYWMADPLQWNEQAGAWFEDIVWVPHHVAALIAGMVGLIALCDLVGERDIRIPSMRQASRVALAGLSFASCFGLSVWVSFGFVATIGAWLILLAAERRWRDLALVASSGVVGLAAACPHLFDLKAGRAGAATFPVMLKVRAFTPVELFLPDALQPLGNLLTLPVSYGIEFGVLALGAVLYWRQRRASGQEEGAEFHRVLTIAALMGLVVGALLTSTLFNNDLGWRVMLLPLLAATVWTIVVLDRLMQTAAPRPFLRSAFMTTLVLGWTTVAYTAVVMRTYPFMTVNPKARFIAADPATERGLRVAFGWAGAHLPHAAVLQQNPTFKRAFAFGMYGRNPIGVADRFASLYGASPSAVEERLDSVGPIFTTRLSTSEIATRAAAAGIDDLIVTAADPVWSDPEAFVWRVKPVFSSDRVRIIPVRVLEAAR